MPALRAMDNFIQDLRYAARRLARSPGFTALVVLTLAIGIGLNAAVFTILDAVLLRALSVKDPQRLVFLSNPDRHGLNGGQEVGARRLFAYHEFEWLRDNTSSFERMCAVQSFVRELPITVGSDVQNGDSERVPINLVTGAYFDVLGVDAVIGRTFAENDPTVELDAVPAVISYNYWKNRFALDTQVIGTNIRVRHVNLKVAGVTRPGFNGETIGFSPAIWIPLNDRTIELTTTKDVLREPKDVSNKYMWLQLIARLKPGVTRERADTDANLALKQLLQTEASRLPENARISFLNQAISTSEASRGGSTLRTTYREPLLILGGLVGLVLLIACANIASLLLARAESRQKEVAMRAALGAGRLRLVQQFLTESLLLAAIGGALGLLFAQWGDALLLRLVSSGGTPVPLELGPDSRVLSFTAAVSLLTSILFGLAPALRAARTDLNSMLKGSATGLTDGSRSGFGKGIYVGRLLVGGQVALSLVLLIAAGLLVHSFQKLANVELGFEKSHLLQINTSPDPGNYNGPANQFHKLLIERIRAIPGVQTVSLSLTGLFRGGINFDMGISVDGRERSPSAAPMAGPMAGPMASVDYIGPDYFRTTGIRLVAGREFGPQDEGNVPLAGVINRTMARETFGDANPIGHQITATTFYAQLNFTIVGVVEDSKREEVRDVAASMFYLPYFNAARSPIFSWAFAEVRVSTDAGTAALPAIRRAVREIAPAMEVPEIKSVDELVSQSVATDRLISQFSSFFGLLSLVLASIGLYGILSYSVATRTQEIGVRMALGAERREIFKLVARQGMTVVLPGILSGLLLAVGLTRLASGLLYDVKPRDPMTFLLVTLFLSLVALAACWVPAWRATRVDPLVALRNQ
jgi:predicted permease